MEEQSEEKVMEITSLSMAINMMSTELGGIICNKDDKQVRTVLRSCTLKPRASQYRTSPKYPEQMSSICAFVFSYTHSQTVNE